jgi:hypothetical protein
MSLLRFNYRVGGARRAGEIGAAGRGFPIDHGFEPEFGAPCLLFKCMRESKEWGPP